MTTPSRARRLSAVIAGCLAVAASLTALGAIVISDVANASVTYDIPSDEFSAPTPVKMVKVKAYVPPEPEVEELDDDDFPTPNFGKFEGY